MRTVRSLIVATPLITSAAKEVMFVSALVSLFVSRIAQELFERFSQNSVDRWRLVIFYLKCAAYKSTYLLTYLLTWSNEVKIRF